MFFIFFIAVLDLAFGFILALYLGGQLGILRQYGPKLLFGKKIQSSHPEKGTEMPVSQETEPGPMATEELAT